MFVYTITTIAVVDGYNFGNEFLVALLAESITLVLSSCIICKVRIRCTILIPPLSCKLRVLLIFFGTLWCFYPLHAAPGA